MWAAVNAKSLKDGTIHAVERTKEGPHQVMYKDKEVVTVEGKAYFFPCAMWARESAVEMVDEPVSCLQCIAAEGGGVP